MAAVYYKSTGLQLSTHRSHRVKTENTACLSRSHMHHKLHHAFSQRLLWFRAQVANTSGDVRRALEVLRRAVELAESEQRKGSSTAVAAAAQAVAAAAGQGSAAGGTAQVKHSHVQIVLKEMYDSPHQVCYVTHVCYPHTVMLAC